MILEFRGMDKYLSNNYECKIKFGDFIYKNAEAAFQAQKTRELRVQKQFTNLTGKAAVRLGQRVKLRVNWDECRNQVMYEVLLAKFTQHKELGKRLRNTNPAELINGNLGHDNLWGYCKCTGCKDILKQNRLGEALTRVRCQLIKEDENDVISN